MDLPGLTSPQSAKRERVSAHVHLSDQDQIGMMRVGHHSMARSAQSGKSLPFRYRKIDPSIAGCCEVNGERGTTCPWDMGAL